MGQTLGQTASFRQNNQVIGDCPRFGPSRFRSRFRNNDISILQDAGRPTGASAADQGVRPTNRSRQMPDVML